MCTEQMLCSAAKRLCSHALGCYSVTVVFAFPLSLQLAFPWCLVHAYFILFLILFFGILFYLFILPSSVEFKTVTSLPLVHITSFILSLKSRGVLSVSSSVSKVEYFMFLQIASITCQSRLLTMKPNHVCSISCTSEVFVYFFLRWITSMEHSVHRSLIKEVRASC